MNENIKPGRWLYGLAIIIFIAGISAFVILLVSSLTSITKSNQRITAPGKSLIVLDKPGKYTIFYEYKSEVGKTNDNIPESPNISGLVCTITDKSDNSPINVSKVRYNSNYSNIDGYSGTSIYYFNIEKSGTYEVVTSLASSNSSNIVLAITQGYTSKIVTAVVGGLATMFGTIIFGTAVIVITFIKRRKCLKSLTEKTL